MVLAVFLLFIISQTQATSTGTHIGYGTFAYTLKTFNGPNEGFLDIGKQNCPSGSAQPEQWTNWAKRVYCCLPRSAKAHHCSQCGLEADGLKALEFWKKWTYPSAGTMYSVDGEPYSACDDVSALRCRPDLDAMANDILNEAGTVLEDGGVALAATANPLAAVTFAAGWAIKLAKHCGLLPYHKYQRPPDSCATLKDNKAPVKCNWCTGQTYTPMSDLGATLTPNRICRSINLLAGEYVGYAGSIHDDVATPHTSSSGLSSTFTWYYPLNYDFEGVSPSCNSIAQKDYVIPKDQYRCFVSHKCDFTTTASVLPHIKKRGSYIDDYCKQRTDGTWPCPNYPSYDIHDFVEQKVLFPPVQNRYRWAINDQTDPIRIKGALLCAAAKEVFCGPGRSRLGSIRNFARARLVPSDENLRPINESAAQVDDTGRYADDGGQGLRLTNEDYDAVCPKCMPGKYSKVLYDLNFTRISQCEECPLGKYAPDWGSKTCVEASVGHFVDLTGRNYSTQAPMGTYVDKRGQSTYQKCPEFYTTERWGATSIGDCKYRAIPPGWYVDIPSLNISYNNIELEGMTKPCPPGTSTLTVHGADEWLAYKFASRRTKCTNCTRNTFAPAHGSSRCTMCPQGRESLQGATQCDRAIVTVTKKTFNQDDVDKERKRIATVAVRTGTILNTDTKLEKVNDEIHATFHDATYLPTVMMVVLIAVNTLCFSIYIAVVYEPKEGDTNNGYQEVSQHEDISPPPYDSDDDTRPTDEDDTKKIFDTPSGLPGDDVNPIISTARLKQRSMHFII